MTNISEKAKVFYLMLLIVFITITGVLWMDYIGMLDLSNITKKFQKESRSVLNAEGDEPSLIEREELEKERQKLIERIEELDKREAIIAEREKELNVEKEKIEEVRKGITLEKKKFEDGKKRHSGYLKNVKDLSQKIYNMPPVEAVKILENWEDTLIIDVLRQLDTDAAEGGRQSISSYLLSLLPKEKASRIMYLMTQI